MLVSRAGARSRRAAVGTHALAALVAGVMVLAGCQSNPEPPPLESASGSPSPAATESPTPAAPTLPAEAKGTSEAAAKAFVRHYVESVNYAMATGDVRTLEELSEHDCASCLAVADNISRLYSNGGHLEGAGWRITAIDGLPSGRGSRAIVQAGIYVSPQKRFSGSESRPERFKGGQQSMTFYLRRAPGTWSVERWSQSS